MESKYFNGAKKLICKKVAKIEPGQDGAIYGGYIFRIDAGGRCGVYLEKTYEKITEFYLDKKDMITPHSNAICFGVEFYEDGDEFPLIYTNIYNNYEGQTDKMEGVCCVYRIIRNDDIFTTQLVQIIRVDFVHDFIWRSKNVADVRPYGNFIVDTDSKSLYAFVMRDEEEVTRFFRFNLPKIADGTMDESFGVNMVTLKTDDICYQFDSEYINYMQGAACDDRFIYSVEGFCVNTQADPVFRIFDTKKGTCSATFSLAEYGLTEEPELIDINENNVYYSDCTGDVYVFTFE